MNEQKYAFLTRMGDNALILGQQLARLCGKGPALEEDMALANVALDLIGQARLWLSYAAEVEGAGRDEDKLAFLRDAHEFHNFLLVEQPNGNYADTLMRQFLFDAWHYFRLQSLSESTDARIAEIAQKSIKEVTYHVRRTGGLIVRLGDGTEESHRKVTDAANDLWMYTGEMFEDDQVAQALASEASYRRPPNCGSHGWTTLAGYSPKPRSTCRPRTHGCSGAGCMDAIPNSWATFSPRCSSCSAHILLRSGRKASHEDARAAGAEAGTGVELACRSQRP
jgi:ring-1,2-phenylacetyl-CoA epoxidase subunit PaaC